MWTSICLYICSSCLRGASSSIPALEVAIFKELARQIDKFKQSRIGRYLNHFFPIPSDLRGAFHWLVNGSHLTETIYGPVTFFLGPAILLVIWTALLIEPPPFIAVVLFLLPRRPVYGIKASYRYVKMCIHYLCAFHLVLIHITVPQKCHYSLLLCNKKYFKIDCFTDSIFIKRKHWICYVGKSILNNIFKCFDFFT